MCFRNHLKGLCPFSSRSKDFTTMCFLTFNNHPTVYEGVQVRLNAHQHQISSLVQSGLLSTYSTIPDALNARDRRDVFPFAYPEHHIVEPKVPQCDGIASLRQLLRIFGPATEDDSGNTSEPEVNKTLKFKAVRTRSALALVLDYMDQPHERMFEVADTDTAALTLSVRTDCVLLGDLSNASASSPDTVGQGPGASLTLGGVNIASSSPCSPPNAINVCDDGDETRVALPTDLPFFWYDEPQRQPVGATNGDAEDAVLALPTDLIYFWPT
ncbi:hypothetical protein EXIGLDRAFT_717001 [Exidia glandulosa HHB12029]|uniref:Uncharacterized protein n=1 Tax=Exidia glandulosa HHB12029 TaxID=1314781 RepID=A0A166AMV0_EXIGL|nr:hypothetical protein EXIGLDRAFT_717001 [Exidia glandulosa HHB12029]